MKSVCIATLFALLSSPVLAETSFVVSNTFQDSGMTGGQEVPTVNFDAAVFADQTATIGDAVELQNFIGFYSIDFAADLSSLTMTVTDTAKPTNNPIPADRFDRYYFTFTGAALTGASIDGAASTAALAGGASVAVVEGKLVVTFGETADITPGNTLIISLK